VTAVRMLVTGAAGFLGRHVSQHLLDVGNDVTGFDLVDPDDPNLAWVVGDLRDSEAVAGAVSNHDVVCHIGAIGDVYLAAEQPSSAASVNVTGTSHVAEAALAAGARVVYASTWEVYGTPHYQPMDEDHPCDPDHPYNITKLAGERLLLAASNLHGLDAVALRLGTAYGSGLRPNSVFRIFIDRARRGEPITIQGDGQQRRQFTHATDIARAFAYASRADVSGIALNTVAAEPISIRQLAEAVTARHPTEIVYAGARPGDVPTALVSSSRIEETLSWKAEVSFSDGLNELLDSLEVES
jgi:UDP-glucose 4-epimerase